MLPPDYRLLERLSRTAPLGIRFVDAATGLAVQAPLEVVAYVKPTKRLPLFANRSNLYVLQNAPRLREFEFVEGTDVVVGDDDFWAAWLPGVGYTIEVNDPSGQYHPCQFRAPVPNRRVFELDPVLHGVPLYATVARPVPANMASVSADLYDPENKRPASWAVLELLLNGNFLARGIADKDGRVSIALPYPEPIDLLRLSPAELGEPLSEQIWPLTMQVLYQPPSASPPQVPQVPERIDLATIFNQPPADLWDAWTLVPPMQTVYPGDTLRYGRPLVLRSSGLSVLYVTV